MSEPFIAEVKIVSFNFPPKGWAFCNGQTLAISQNQALFSILGTTYGGNGTVAFALPNLQARSPIHYGNGPGLTNYALGQNGGTESVSLTPDQMPAHSHQAFASANSATTSVPTNAVVAKKARFGKDVFAPPGNPVPMRADALTPAGASQPHDNMQPYLTLNFVIALVGIFPSRN
jgi:microcystin-dependent protein